MNKPINNGEVIVKKNLDGEILEVIFGNSCYMSMKSSNLNQNKILMFNALFNVEDLSTVNEYKIKIPEELCHENSNYCFKKETDIICDAIQNNKKIRIGLVITIFILNYCYYIYQV